MGKLHNKVGRAADRRFADALYMPFEKASARPGSENSAAGLTTAILRLLRGFPHFDGVRRVLPLGGVLITIVRVWGCSWSFIYIYMM